MTIDEMKISARAKACLKNAGYTNVLEIKDLSDEDFLNIHNLNEKVLAEIKGSLKFLNFDDEENGILLNSVVSELGLSENTINRLSKYNIEIVRELCCLSENELFRIVGKSGKQEVLEKINVEGLSIRSEGVEKHLYYYPENIKKIAKDKNDDWEYLLYIEAALCNYNRLRQYRNKIVVKKNEDDFKLDSFLKFWRFWMDQIDKCCEVCNDMDTFGDEYIMPALGEPGEEGDEYEIIIATEVLFGYYKKIIKWNKSLRQFEVDSDFVEVYDKLCDVAGAICKSFDTLYDNYNVAKKKFEDLDNGLLLPEDCQINLGISFEGVDMQGLTDAFSRLQRKYYLV